MYIAYPPRGTFRFSLNMRVSFFSGVTFRFADYRWGKPYTYFPQKNTVKTDALPYLQIEQVSSYLTTVEYLYTDNKGQKVYGQLNYEPMNDYELAALWRGFKEE